MFSSVFDFLGLDVDLAFFDFTFFLDFCESMALSEKSNLRSELRSTCSSSANDFLCAESVSWHSDLCEFIVEVSTKRGRLVNDTSAARLDRLALVFEAYWIVLIMLQLSRELNVGGFSEIWGSSVYFWLWLIILGASILVGCRSSGGFTATFAQSSDIYRI